ncbi:fused response regulator/phosphatase [Mucilaginibacter agri]|uniref:SpoIIE family protein phosphatase n=1 Tax=Mucilaginibacter agri TaxID=2695265 RepID=A0A965ZJE5_9SPHI|nr:fused response regulator/phosphatase [Mucilaginibacter agri]NCD72244.1 SpoIIE family protein phosphatase [Mucilaginibacter agri]
MTATPTLKKILLVDDNPLFLKMMAKAFNKAGFECVIAHSANEAIRHMATDVPHAILSDYQMPIMNGIEFRKYVLKQPLLKDIPFIFLTDFSDKDLVITGLGLQAIDYVLKDTPVSVIVTKLYNLLNTVSKQRELSEMEVKKAAAALNIRTVPQKAPDIEGYEINFWHQTFQDIPGGDFIDFIPVTDRFNFIILGDVMGKKWMAWFLSFSFLSYIRAAVRFGVSSQEYSPAGILAKVNEIICGDDALKDILATLSLLMVDKETNQITYAGAGDLPVIHYQAKTKKFEQLRCSGLLLGMFADGQYDEKQIDMRSGDQLFIFTDGIIDYATADGAKSDYNLFTAQLEKLTGSSNSFNKVKQFLIQHPPHTVVDDSSIIHIYKK